ncbi:MAG: right-handed parallel beta-helix repeat-containing protein [Clostridia bacterium]|nr:right-handed parallel beta-helix repeat-containing protein [Clostridia bacterium]
MFNDLTKCMGMEVSAAEYKTPDQAKNAFRFLIGVAGTAYCVRVYDRVLTKAEMAQNHVADLFYYYGIDRSLLDNCLVGMEDNSELIYGAFGDIGFDLTTEEAKSAITKKVAAIWLTYDGLAIRRDGKDGLRYYFSVTPEAVSALAVAGARVELGALVNVGKGMAPIIDGDAYDYKIVTYDSVAGKHAPFYVDEDTFAVTVKYENADRAASLSEINVCGYVKVTYANGETVVFYTDAASPTEIENTLFGVYDRMKVHDGVKKDSLLADQVKNRIEACYERVPVHVQAGAAAGGDGSAEKPYHSFAQGFNKCKELFATAGKPINVVLYLGDGEYGIYEKQTLTAADMPYTYSKFEITSKNGKSTLTTTKNLTESFTEYADNVWFCQLEKENGSYPSFRYLYVDGEMADLSYSGARYSYDEGHYVSGFERDYDGPWGKCYELYKAGLLRKDSGSGYPAYRTDLIASFESYKTRFLALMEMERLYAAKSLNIDTQAMDFSDDAYVAAFEELKLWRIALDDLKAQNEEKNRGKDYNASLSAFKKFTASPEYAGNAAYEAMLISIRDQIAALSATSLVFGNVTPRVTTTAIEEGKYYLPLEMVGDLTAALVEGKAQAKAKYQTLLAAYNAADAAGKAAMEDELAAAALRASDESRYRYALEGKGLELHHAGQWWYNIVHITGIDYEDTAYDSEYNEHVAVYLDVEEYASFHVHKTYSMKGRYVHLKNALDYVDSESEYFYDETTGKLYYYSESGVDGKTFARGTSDYMFWFEGIKEVTVSDLEITGVDDNHLSHNHGCYGLGGVVGRDNTLYYDRSAIRLRDCFGLTVVNCNFHDLGARAIHGDGKLENIYIESNVFTRLGAGAVHFGAGSLERNWNYATNYIEDVVISDNYAHDISREYYSDSVIWLHYGKDVDITHNTVDLCSYTAISVGWNFNTPTWTPGERYQMYNVNISSNYLTGFMHEIGDGGGIYVSGGNAPKDWTENFNYIRENFVLLNNVTGNGLGHFLVGIYFDGSTSNWLCSNNVVTEQSYGAVPGEDDDLYESGDPYVTALRNRYTGTVFIYLQHIVVQITHNILCENNFILNVRAKTPEAQKQEVYRTYVVAERNLREVNTVYVTDVNRIPALAEEIIYASGCFGHEGDPTILYENNY